MVSLDIKIFGIPVIVNQIRLKRPSEKQFKAFSDGLCAKLTAV
ncbi:hypothetical protein [Neisseria animaloris]|nr:hypothetical protein [Neisseria animaloris]